MTKPRRAIRFSLIGLLVLMTLTALYFALIRLGGICCAGCLLLVAVAGAVLSGQQEHPTVPADADRDPDDRG